MNINEVPEIITDTVANPLCVSTDIYDDKSLLPLIKPEAKLVTSDEEIETPEIPASLLPTPLIRYFSDRPKERAV